MHKQCFFGRSFKLLVILSFTVIFTHCGGGGSDFSMPVATTVTVTDVTSGTSEVKQLTGSLSGNVAQDFTDRSVLTITTLSVTGSFATVGVDPITLSLDTSTTSTATIYKLNASNQVLGTHTMDLDLTVDTPDEDLTLSDVGLENTTSILALSSSLPTLAFQTGGNNKEIEISIFRVQIPPNLIATTQNTN